MMKIIGVTGSSGAGKSTVCDILKKRYSVHIIDADKIAKELSKKGSIYLKEISKCFGKEILDETGELNRKKLANIIYNDGKKRNELNNITFTYVVAEIKERINNLKDEELVVIDAPLLFESNLNEICDIVIGVISNEEDKVIRICKRDNIDENLAKKRLSIQINDEYLKEKVDYIIYNNNQITNLYENIENIINFIYNKNN